MTPATRPLRLVLDAMRPLTYGIVQAGDDFPGGVPYIRPIDMTATNGVKVVEGLLRTSPAIAAQYKRSEVRTGDVVLSIGPSYGKVMIVPSELDGANLTQGTARLAPGNDVTSRWLYWILQSQPVREYWDTVVAGGTFSALNLAPLGATPIHCPPLDVQRRIADFLDDQVARIDTVGQLRSRQRRLAHEVAQSQITAALLRGGAVLGSPPWFTDLPEDVAVRPLRALWRVIDCKHRTPEYVDEGIPVVSPGDVRPGLLDLSVCHRFVDETDYRDLADDLRRCLPGDIVYSRNASAGTAAFIDSPEPFTMGQDVCRITSQYENQRYLTYALNYLVKPQLDAVRVGSTFTRINVDQIKALRVPVPSRDQQDKIAQECLRLGDQETTVTTALDRSLCLLEDRKRSLITAAVTGEFDVSTASSRARHAAMAGQSVG